MLVKSPGPGAGAPIGFSGPRVSPWGDEGQPRRRGPARRGGGAIPTTPHLKPRPRPRRLSGAARRETLLDAAAETAAELGLDHVTMERVAERVGVHKKVAYLYFPNRDAVLVALFEREHRRLDAEVASATEPCVTFEEKIRAIVATYLTAIQSERLHIHNVAASGLSGPILEYQQRRSQDVIEYFVELIRSRASVSEQAARAGAIVFIYGLEGLIIQARERGGDPRQLEDLYVGMSAAALERLERDAPA